MINPTLITFKCDYKVEIVADWDHQMTSEVSWAEWSGQEKQQRRQRNLTWKNDWEMVTILWLVLLPGILYCWQSTLQMDWLKRRWSKCRERKIYCCLFTKVKFSNFTLSFGRLRQRLVVKCVPHVQHDYFSSFNQWDHCFLVSPLPSSLQKLPSVLIWLRKPSSIKLFSWYV